MSDKPEAWQQVLAAPEVRHARSAVVFAVLHRITGDTLADGTLLSVDVAVERGGFRWERDTLFVAPGTIGSFTLDQTGRRVDPSGFLFVEVEDESVTRSAGSGAYAALAPAVGERLPLALPLTESLALDFDLTGYQRRDIDIHVFSQGDPLSATAAVPTGRALIIRPDPFDETVFVGWPPPAAKTPPYFSRGR